MASLRRLPQASFSRKASSFVLCSLLFVLWPLIFVLCVLRPLFFSLCPLLCVLCSLFLVLDFQSFSSCRLKFSAEAIDSEFKLRSSKHMMHALTFPMEALTQIGICCIFKLGFNASKFCNSKKKWSSVSKTVRKIAFLRFSFRKRFVTTTFAPVLQEQK